jgi:hypothetical protein
VNYCIHICARPHLFGEFECFLIFILTLADGLCCAWFIYPIRYQCGRPEIWTSSIDWAQLSRFHLKMETEPSVRNVVF